MLWIPNTYNDQLMPCSRLEVDNHRVVYRARFKFPCKMNAAASSGVLETARCRISMRMVRMRITKMRLFRTSLLKNPHQMYADLLCDQLHNISQKTIFQNGHWI